MDPQFQFLDGAIKRKHGCELNQNSNGFQFLDGAIKSEIIEKGDEKGSGVSIP